MNQSCAAETRNLFLHALGYNRRYDACCANDRFSIRKRTLCAAAPNDGTWPVPAVGAGRPLRLIGALRQAKPIPGRDSRYEYMP